MVQEVKHPTEGRTNFSTDQPAAPIGRLSSRSSSGILARMEGDDIPEFPKFSLFADVSGLDGNPVFEFIDWMSQAKKLTIYLGAGATIDRTGLDWSGLVSHLLDYGLTKTHDNEREKDPRHRFIGQHVARVGLTRAGTEAAALLRIGDRPNERVRKAIQGALYPAGLDGDAGVLARAVTDLCATRIKKGLSTTILTTNYDVTIEDAVRKAAATYYNSRSFPEGLTIKVAQLGDNIRKGSTAEFFDGSVSLSIVYLHGRIPLRDADKIRRTKLTRGDDKTALWLEPKRIHSGMGDPVPVVGELEFQNRAAASENLISEALTETDMLLIGSSITDVPLVYSLARTRSKRSGYLARAVLCRQDPVWRPLADDLQTLAETTHEARFSDLGLKPIFVNYFGEVAQLVNEVNWLTDHHNKRSRRKTPYVEWKDSYEILLRKWWAQWSYARRNPMNRNSEEFVQYTPHPFGSAEYFEQKRKFHEAPIEARNQSERTTEELVDSADPSDVNVQELEGLDDHELVRFYANWIQETAAGISAISHKPWDALKLELWARWDPNSVAQELRLYASSYGPIERLAAMPRTPLGWDSSHPAAITYMNGRTCTFGPDGKWKVGSIGLPIRIPATSITEPTLGFEQVNFNKKESRRKRRTIPVGVVLLRLNSTQVGESIGDPIAVPGRVATGNQPPLVNVNPAIRKSDAYLSILKLLRQCGLLCLQRQDQLPGEV